MTLVAIIFRCCIIAFKYATYDPAYLAYLKNRKVPLQELYKKIYMQKWVV
jgi:hypothetical protein